MFRFKQFTIHQSLCAMKVGTDGVLLGAWTALGDEPRRVLDLGTGTGVIALMMAQRTAEAQIVGVDIDAVDQARQNGEESPWKDRLTFVQCAVQEFETDPKFDLIVSNPPFFVDSLQCPDQERTQARHTVTLSFEELIAAADRLLSDRGRLAVVLPIVEGEQFLRSAMRHFHLTRRTEVKTTPKRAPKRVLMEFARQAVGEVENDFLIIGTGEHETYTEEYKRLTRDFYLKF